MLKTIRNLCITLVAFGGLCSPVMAIDAETILQKADEVRNPSNSYKLWVKVETKGEDTLELEVSIKGKDKTFVKTIKPVRDRDKDMLMLGEDMWVFVPNLTRSVRVSLNQKLVGQASNGDITRQRWSGDYAAEIEKSKGKAWVLMLTANKKGLTYDKIRLWVEKKKFFPKKAEYLSKNGLVLKKAQFRAYKKLEGAMRPSEILIKSATDENAQSLITIVNIENMDFPDTVFNQNNMK